MTKVICRSGIGSLQRRLSIWLSVTILIAGLAATVVSFFIAYDDAKEFQDHMLRQIAYLDTLTPDPSARPAPTTKKKPGKSFGEYTTRISILHLPDDPRPVWLSADPKTGFSTYDADGGRIRVFAYEGSPGRTTVVAQPTRARDELTMNSALFALIPLLLLLPALVWLTLRVVRIQLAPVSSLASHLDLQPADRPQPLSDQGLPSEIVPFVHAINRLLERVSALMKQQRRFIADAAHELRTPLTALRIQAANLKHAESLETMRERAIPLENGIERAQKLTEQLLDMARVQSETLDAAAVDVSAMARELISDFLPMAEAKRIDLGLDEASPVTMVVAAETLRRLLRNILENSLKYTPNGGEVTLRLCSTDGADCIEVIDSGPGIPEAERARVFDSFYRIPGHNVEGSGLGLSIAREAALKLGGTLSLHDRTPGSGLIVRYQQHHDT